MILNELIRPVRLSKGKSQFGQKSRLLISSWKKASHTNGETITNEPGSTQVLMSVIFRFWGSGVLFRIVWTESRSYRKERKSREDTWDCCSRLNRTSPNYIFVTLIVAWGKDDLPKRKALLDEVVTSACMYTFLPSFLPTCQLGSHGLHILVVAACQWQLQSTSW